jgi:hypothetical protein
MILPYGANRSLERSPIGSSLHSRPDDISGVESPTFQLPTKPACRSLQFKDVILLGYTLLVLSFDYLASIDDSHRVYCPTDTIHRSLSVP